MVAVHGSSINSSPSLVIGSPADGPHWCPSLAQDTKQQLHYITKIDGVAPLVTVLPPANPTTVSDTPPISDTMVNLIVGCVDKIQEEGKSQSLSHNCVCRAEPLASLCMLIISAE